MINLKLETICLLLASSILIFTASVPSIAKEEKSRLPIGNEPLPVRWYVSIYAARDIPKGKRIEKSDVLTKPVLESEIPCGTICVLKNAIGKKVVVNIKKGSRLGWVDVGMYDKQAYYAKRSIK